MSTLNSDVMAFLPVFGFPYSDVVSRVYLQNCALAVLSRYGLTDGLEDSRHKQQQEAEAHTDFLEAMHMAGSNGHSLHITIFYRTRITLNANIRVVITAHRSPNDYVSDMDTSRTRSGHTR